MSQGYEGLDWVLQWAAIAMAKDIFVTQCVWVKSTAELGNMSKGIQIMATKTPQVLWEDLRAFFFHFSTIKRLVMWLTPCQT